ncbi:MAG: hypothetical protein EDM05_038760 [Leptolyngbya sp. IPPAS B-1204]|nr:hypothetical protein [Elainella sp. C42_A2020_010]RNJ70728.1 MAG: hypothetical protein EDM05_01760 [Leptolyngbya sp. IPPAS B-1204]
MKAVINQRLFTETSIDSGALSMLGMVVHRFDQPGEYQGTVLRDGQVVAKLVLTVDECSTATQVNIDLAALNAREMSEFSVNVAGYAVFHVSRGVGGYSVVLRRSEDCDTDEFDSRELNAEDSFAATLLRPGIYRVTETYSGYRGEIVVAYPDPAALRCPLDPISIGFDCNGFVPDWVEVQPTQGIVYRIEERARIQIDLVEPIDR